MKIDSGNQIKRNGADGERVRVGTERGKGEVAFSF